ncbi:archaeal proteasome endopeptidase complex subunit alpha [Candidatus Woesearchaeota archaeon]|nr:archaeal proteasome endopeptidase complex subunit alpha [Candidatus Woesearchaeota archaeon]MCF8013998.1 archaeal proteasome endopeptidase complex subunit alpha [Candidatus Woesearchaeota archaeon]
MEPIQHQMMGYDRAITMFSPDGRLLQVEYAKRTVRLGNTAIGIVCKDGIILVTDKRLVDKLVVPDAIEKIFKIDDHMMSTAAGILSDARVLVERAQVKAQQHKVEYDSPVDNIVIVKDLCNLMQYTTQSGGLRPFGVSLLIAGIDETGMALFETDPTGLYYQYKATVIGEGETDIEEQLHKEYKDTMTMDEGLSLAIKMLKKALNNNFQPERIDAAIIPLSTKKMEKVSKEKIEKLIK